MPDAPAASPAPDRIDLGGNVLLYRSKATLQLCAPSALLLLTKTARDTDLVAGVFQRLLDRCDAAYDECHDALVRESKARTEIAELRVALAQALAPKPRAGKSKPIPIMRGARDVAR